MHWFSHRGKWNVLVNIINRSHHRGTKESRSNKVNKARGGVSPVAKYGERERNVYNIMHVCTRWSPRGKTFVQGEEQNLILETKYKKERYKISWNISFISTLWTCFSTHLFGGGQKTSLTDIFIFSSSIAVMVLQPIHWLLLAFVFPILVSALSPGETIGEGWGVTERTSPAFPAAAAAVTVLRTWWQ